MLVLHAISGCDTVSAIYRIEPFNLLQNKRDYGMLNLFLNSDSIHEGIQRAGESIFLKQNDASKCASLDGLRNICYKKLSQKHIFLHPFSCKHCPQQVPQPNNNRFEHISLCRNG